MIRREGESTSELWVIAARHGAGTQPVTITGLPATVGEGTVYTESRSVDVANGSFTDTFSRWDVHVYRFEVPTPPSPAPPAPPPPPAEPPAPPPAPNPVPLQPAATRPLALRASSAATLRRGRLLTRRIRVTTDRGSRVTNGVVSCGARVGKVRARVVRRGWRSGAAYCTWTVPRRARAKAFRGVIRVASGGLAVTHRFAARVSWT